MIASNALLCSVVQCAVHIWYLNFPVKLDPIIRAAGAGAGAGEGEVK